MAEDFLDARTRAEDIILGSLGFDTTVHILYIHEEPGGFRGQARSEAGEVFDFSSEDDLSPLEQWAIRILSTEFHQEIIPERKRA